MPLVPTGSSPCFSGSESGFDRIGENHLTGLWSTGRRGRRVRVGVCWHPNRNDNCPRPPSPRRHVDLHLARITKARAATIDLRAQADDARCHPGRTTFPHPSSAAFLGAVHVDATARFATRREYDEAIRIIKDDVVRTKPSDACALDGPSLHLPRRVRLCRICLRPRDCDRRPDGSLPDR
jgi:ribosomal protein S14